MPMHAAVDSGLRTDVRALDVGTFGLVVLGPRWQGAVDIMRGAGQARAPGITPSHLLLGAVMLRSWGPVARRQSAHRGVSPSASFQTAVRSESSCGLGPGRFRNCYACEPDTRTFATFRVLTARPRYALIRSRGHVPRGWYVDLHRRARWHGTQPRRGHRGACVSYGARSSSVVRRRKMREHRGDILTARGSAYPSTGPGR